MSGPSKPEIKIEPGQKIKLSPLEETLIRRLFREFEQIRVNDELAGGYVARVLLVTPWREDRKAAQVVKLGPLGQMEDEKNRFEKYIQDALPLLAPQMTGFVQEQETGAIAYIYLRGNVLAETNVLQAYYLAKSEKDILRCLKSLLIDGLGQGLYQEVHPGKRDISYEDFYSRYFLPDITMTATEIDTSPLPEDSDVRTFTGEAAVWELRDYAESGNFVQLDNFRVNEKEDTRLTLCHHIDPFRVRVTLTPTQSKMLPVTKGQIIYLRGRITNHRHQALTEIVDEIFSEVNATELQLSSDKIEIAGASYPHPLTLYAHYLHRRMPRNLTNIHGDLHLFNVIIDSFDKPWLIDFGRVGEGHALFDFVELEVHLRHAILGETDFSIAEWVNFERRLICALTPKHHLGPPSNPELKKAYTIINGIRDFAWQYAKEKEAFAAEYLPALFLYSLATLKFHKKNGPRSARHAFLTAVITAAYLENEPICRELPRPIPRPKPLKPPLKKPPIHAYIESMKPIPPHDPALYMASSLVSNILFYHFVITHPEWQPGGIKMQEGYADAAYLRHWRDGSPPPDFHNLPVTNISFHAAAAFAAWLSAQTQTVVRLPTLAEWETAVHANRKHWLEEELAQRRICYRELPYYGPYPRSVDLTPTNPWGIRDLLGNAYDMCTASDRLFRVGGCFTSSRKDLQVQHLITDKTTCRQDTGFRCVRLIKVNGGEQL